MDLIDIFRLSIKIKEEYVFFLSAHRSFSRIDHILGHKSSPSEFKKLKSYQRSFLTTVLYETRYQLQGEKTAKNTNSWRLNNILLNNKEVTEERRREIKRFLETNDNENTTGFSKSSSKRKVFSNTVLPQETRKASNRQPNSTS